MEDAWQRSSSHTTTLAWRMNALHVWPAVKQHGDTCVAIKLLANSTDSAANGKFTRACTSSQYTIRHSLDINSHTDNMRCLQALNTTAPLMAPRPVAPSLVRPALTRQPVASTSTSSTASTSTPVQQSRGSSRRSVSARAAKLTYGECVQAVHA